MTDDSPAASRRAFLKGGSLAVAAAGAVLSTQAEAQTPPPPKPVGGLSGSADGPVFAVAETAHGRVQGIVNAGIREFKNIPYGAPTGGRNRFMPPQKAASWTGVRDCIGYGQISPQTAADLRSDYAQLIMWDRHVVGGMSEDVLHLNVWTPGVDNAKRAVLVSNWPRKSTSKLWGSWTPCAHRMRR